MKIHFRDYKDNFISPYAVMKFFIRTKGYNEFDHTPPKWLEWACSMLQTVRNKLSLKQKKIQIDEWDTFSMYRTLADIIAPMLRQLKDTKHGSAFVGDEHVPIGLRSFVDPAPNKYEPDGKFHMRWNYVLDEMIWAFEQIENDNQWEDQYHHGVSDILWMKLPNGLSQMTKGPKDTHWIDNEGIAAHQVRMQNGFNLFGIYYQSLWD